MDLHTSPVPLPFCPRPYSAESAWSWLSRVGTEYGYTPSRFLRATGLVVDRGRLPPLRDTLALSPAAIDALGRLACLPSEQLQPMWAVPVEWHLVVKANRPLCPRCWLEDLDADRTPYEREPWRHAWRVLCERHGTPLQSAASVFTSRRWYPRGRSTLTLDAGPLHRRLDEQASFDRTFPSERPAIVSVLREVERAFDGAVRGWPPDDGRWRGISAKEFLIVADDVTTWSLNNFESVPATTVADEWPRFEDLQGYGLFAWRRRRSRIAVPGQPMIRLIDIIDPAVRRSVLWIVHLLLASRHPEVRPRTGLSAARRPLIYMLSQQYPSALFALLQRTQYWPDAFDSLRSDLEQVLGMR